MWFDPSLNGGLGGWVQLPVTLGPGGTPLVVNAGPPPLVVNSPVTADGRVVVTVNFPGTFALVAL